MDNFIKVLDPNVAEELVRAGFSYVKENSGFAFPETPELKSFLLEAFSSVPLVRENRLQF